MSEILFNVANVVALIGYLVTDIFWLRIFAVVSGVVSLIAVLLLPEAQTSWIVWGVIYNVINLVQIARLFLERRPVRLDAAEQELWALAFRTLTPRELKKLAALATWEEAAAGTRLVEEGTKLDRLLLVVEGEAGVIAGGKRVATLGEGRFVGEMSFVTGAPTTAAVDAATPMRFVSFPSEALRAFLAKNPDLRAALQLIMSRDLVAKLRPGSSEVPAEAQTA